MKREIIPPSGARAWGGQGRPVAITGMFDMRNFGDLIFPLIAANRLGPHGYNIVPVSATGRPTGLRDALPSRPFEELLGGDWPAAGVIVGGGYLLHTHRMDVLEEYRDGDIGAWTGPALWLGAILAAAAHDVPALLNAPGVPHPIGARHRSLVASALAAADYVSVRDGGSRAMLPLEGLDVAVVPDTAAELARLWPRPSLGSAFADLAARKGFDPAARLLAVHVRQRSIKGLDVAELAAMIDAFAEAHALLPLLIGVGSSHGDDRFATALSHRLSGPSVLLDDPLGLREIAAALAHAALYIGSSLHGYVAAAAYEVPAALVAKPAYQKFGGFLDHIDRRTAMARDWRQAFEIGAAALGTPAGPLPDRLFEALDRHWDRIITALAAGPAPNRAARLAYMRHVLAAGCREDGVGWAMLPFVGQAMRARAAAGDDVRGMEVF